MYKDNTSDIQKHSAAHVLAMAISRVFKNTKVGIGPVTKDGFYYDVDVSQTIDQKNIVSIENEINNIIQQNLSFQQIILPRDQAMNFLLQRGQIYKAELINSIPDSEISLYKTGEEFVDLCRGPHVHTTNQIGIVKIMKIENSFWNEDINRAKLQRVYGMVFDSLNNYNEYLQFQKDLISKNYKAVSIRNNLAVKLDNDLYYTDRGTILSNRIREIIYQLLVEKYNTRNIEFNHFFNNEVEAYSVLNKVSSIENKSYKDFPLTYYAEYKTKSLSFNKNAQNFTINTFQNFLLDTDAISYFVKQLEGSIKSFKKLDIDFTSDIHSEDFDQVYVQTISNILQKNLVSHNKIITPPSNFIEIYFKVKDTFNKEWDIGFIRLKKVKNLKDKNIVEVSYNFIISEIWKFIVEKYVGIFPPLLSTTQVICIPVNNKYNEYADKISDLLNKQNYLTRSDKSSKSLKYRIWRAEKENIPIQLILGEKESMNNTISIRQNHINLGLMSIDNLLSSLHSFFSTL